MNAPQRSLQERVFESWAVLMLAHRFWFLGLTLVITLAFGLVCVQLPVMTTLRDFLSADAQGMPEWEAARERFGGDESIVFAVESETHFTAEGMERLSRLVTQFEAHPLVDRVISFVNAQNIRADGENSIVIGSFIDSEESPEEIKKRVLADRSLGQHLVSKDGNTVMVIVQLVANENDVAKRPEVAAEVAERIKNMRGLKSQMAFPDGPRRVLELSKSSLGAEFSDMFIDAGFPENNIHSAGFTVLIASMIHDANRNMTVLFPITILILFLTLIFLFRRFSDAVLPLICVGPAVIWSVAIGGLIFGRLTIVTSMVPVMVLVVGISDVVHLVTQYRHELARGHEQEKAIIISFREVGAACTLTSLTTFIGFGSMILLPLPYARELGVFAGLGVVNAFVVSFILTPIFLSFKKVASNTKEKYAHDFLFTFLTKLNDFMSPRPGSVLIVGVLFSAFIGGLLTLVQVENSLTRKLAKNHPMRKSVNFIDSKFGGSGEVEILIDTKRPDGLVDPAILSAMITLEEWIEKNDEGSSVFSLVNVLETMHSNLFQESKERVPLTKEAIAQYLLLFEMSGGEDLEALLDDTRQHTRMTVRIGDRTGEEVVELGEKISAQIKLMFPDGVYAEPNGLGLQSARLAPAILSASLQGFGSAILLIAVLMGLLFQAFRLSILCLLPNIVPVAVSVLGVYFLLEQFDADSLTYVSICIGIAVDDTIHLLSRYRLERQRGAKREDAVQATILEAGHGIIRTSVILVCGFSVLWVADYQPIKTMGLMLPLCLLSAVILDLTVVPAMAQLGLLEPKIKGASSDSKTQAALG